MWIERLRVTKFLDRSEDVDIYFNRDLTILTGRNGAGKTSLMKLLWYVMSGNILLALREVPFGSLEILTSEYRCKVTRTGSITCEVEFEREGKKFLFEDLTDEDGDIFENAEDQADSSLQKVGSSIFLPTFRRIEGGFSLGRRSRRNALYTGLLASPHSEKSDVETALSSLSDRLSNKSHLFVSAISTSDISALLLKKYGDLSDEYTSKQREMSQQIVDRIKNHKETSDRDEAEPANQVLDTIISQIEETENERSNIMSPISAIQNVVRNIFHHGGIKFGTRLSFGDAALAINSDSLSAGEKQMLSFVSYNGLNSNTVFFIDEPELSLHVDWQRQMFSILKEQQSSNQFIIATHSPFIYSQYPDKEAQISKSRGDELA